MKSSVQQWGNSPAIRIPKHMAKEMSLKKGTPVELRLSEQNLVVSPAKCPRYTLEELLAGITPENLHEEIPTGPPVGNEVW